MSLASKNFVAGKFPSREWLRFLLGQNKGHREENNLYLWFRRSADVLLVSLLGNSLVISHAMHFTLFRLAMSCLCDSIVNMIRDGLDRKPGDVICLLR